MGLNTLQNEAPPHDKQSLSDLASVSTLHSQDGKSAVDEETLLPDQKKLSTGRLVLVLGSLWVPSSSLLYTLELADFLV